jgi:Pyruvate/2-oxoacid:ferredoxin oxidoreductase delta subunit
MKLFYFSGTGNSLYAAKKIREHLGAGDLAPINTASREGEIRIHDDAIGLVFPVYFRSIPRIVADFASRLSCGRRPYIFGLATHNGGPGLANRALGKALGKAGLALSSGFELLMPGNSVIIKNYTNPPEVRNDRLEKAEASLAAIAEAVRGRRPNAIRKSESFGGRIESAMTRTAMKLYRLPRHFKSDEKCVSCGACARICPRANIRVAVSVSWGRDCENCLACFHWCPKRAIQIDSYTQESLRYHHPKITARELTTRP